MKQILKKLWETYQTDHAFTVSDEEKELMAMLVAYEDKQTTMTEEQKVLVQSIEECWSQMCAVSEQEAFIKGVRFAMMFVVDVFGY